MKNNIITNNINGLQFNELRDFMQNCIEESINALDYNDFEHIEWYKDCDIESYFVEWTEIWDEDEKIGKGLDTIAHKFVLNDETRADFEKAFEHARDKAYKNCTYEFCENIDDDEFETIMGMTKEQYKESCECDWLGVAKGYHEAVCHFCENDFRDITWCTNSLEDFAENAEGGQKAEIEGKTYYKVRNCVTDQYYVVYFDEDGDLIFY